jgi:hypothetical protein
MFEVNSNPPSANAITSLAETNAFLAEQVMPKVYQQLQLFASDPTFVEQLKLPFGDTWDIQKAQTLATEWLTGNFSTLAPIKIVTSADIKGSSGGFADATNQIYLAEDILTGSNVNQAVSVVLEEIGHSLDPRLNSSDSLGDEGEIFANIVQGKVLSPEQIQTLKSEDDATVVILDGETVVLEMNLQSDWYVWRYSDWRKNDGNVDWFNPEGRTIQKGNRPDSKDGIYINWGLGSPFDASNISNSNNSDYFAVHGSAYADFEAGKTYKFTVNADDGIILTAQPKDQKLTINGVITPYDTAQNKYAWQKYDDNNPQAKEYNFTPDQTGTYRVNFWSYDITGNASVDISWENSNSIIEVPSYLGWSDNYEDRAYEGYKTQEWLSLSGAPIQLTLGGLANIWNNENKDDAAELLQHYLGNTGTTKDIDLSEAEQESNGVRDALKRGEDQIIEKAKQAVENGFQTGNIKIGAQGTNLIGNNSYYYSDYYYSNLDNWQAALGKFDMIHEGNFSISPNDRKINISITSTLKDVYDFEDFNPAHFLHLYGTARNFAVTGKLNKSLEISY